MTKDREHRRPLDAERTVFLNIERSSTHPVEYAITLLAMRAGELRTVRLFDNRHETEEHHEHAYVRDEKQDPVVTHGPVNLAMHAAELKVRESWRDIVSEWEQTWHT